MLRLSSLESSGDTQMWATLTGKTVETRVTLLAVAGRPQQVVLRDMAIESQDEHCAPLNLRKVELRAASWYDGETIPAINRI